MSEIPTKPYLLRALYEWCVDNGYTPHLTVRVDSRTQVPTEHVRNGEITLNVSPTAVHNLQMGNALIEFSARFGGVARQLSIPVDNVVALYARESGQGMTFDLAAVTDGEYRGAPDAPRADDKGHAAAEPPDGPEPAPGGRPRLRRVK